MYQPTQWNKIQNTQRSTELITSLGAIPGAGGVQISIGLNSGPATWVTRTCSGHWTWAGVNPVLMRSSRAALNFGASIALQLYAPYWFIQVPQVPCQLPEKKDATTLIRWARIKLKIRIDEARADTWAYVYIWLYMCDNANVLHPVQSS